MGQFLTPQEVADLLKIKKNTVYEMVKRGEIKGVKVGKQLRIDADVLQYVDSLKYVAHTGGSVANYVCEGVYKNGGRWLSAGMA